MKKIVIIGGCGYIGSKLFTHLQEKGYVVDTVDLEWFGNFINPKNIKCDYKDLPKNFFHIYDVVILLAGHSTIGLCREDIIGSLRNNIESFVILMQKLKKQKFIYASTYRVYNETVTHSAKETDNYRNSFSIYDLTKKTIDDYISFSSLEFYSLRMATANGYSPNLRLNQTINKMYVYAKNKKKITVYDQEANFSILGLEDLCRVIEKIILSNDRRGIYNIGSFDCNVNLIIKELSKVFNNIDISIEESPKKSHHIKIDTSKFQKTYNFDFRESLKSIIASLVNNFSKKNHTITSL